MGIVGTARGSGWVGSRPGIVVAVLLVRLG